MKSLQPPLTYSSKPELLSPAGNWESLQAAVKNGADAVYLGTREFNARAKARNFGLDEIKKCVDYCHSQGVKTYLTLNILVKNSELGHFFEILSRAYISGIDGVILQHLSFVELVKRNYPDLSVFISTQGAVGNTLSATLMKAADRIIVPREMPLPEIKKMIEAGIKVEIFVHGALCFSVSGLCLLSSFVSGRSGNRGNCAQLCRQEFNREYPMSTRELCTVSKVPDFIKAGITAFKIEGRMRSPLYVAVATRLYRRAIDLYFEGEFKVPQKEMEEIEVVFNREFTTGMISGDKEVISSEKPMNRGAFLGIMDNGLIILNKPVKTGDGLGLWTKDNVTGAVIQSIKKNGQTVESAAAGDTVELGINAKSGTRVYLTSTARINIEPDFKILRAPLKTSFRKQVRAYMPELEKRKAPVLLRFMARAYSLAEAVDIAQAGADIIFYNIFAPDFPESGSWQFRSLLGAYIPRVLNDRELNLAISVLNRKRVSAIMTGNLGFLARRPSFSVPLYLDYSFNVFNDIDIHFYRKFNVIPVLSPELSLAELTGFKDREVVILCHGDIVLVNTCIDLHTDSLKDDKGSVFPVRKESSYWQILNSRPYGVFNDIKKLRAIGFNQFYIDQKDHSARYVQLYREILKTSVPDRRERKGFTAGHLYKGVE